MEVRDITRWSPVEEDADFFADKVREELGYTILRRRAPARGVAEALAAAGVRPYDPAQVEKYKAEKVAGTARRLVCWKVLASVAVLALIAAGWAFLFPWDGTSNVRQSDAGVGLWLTSVLFVSMLAGLWGTWLPDSWQESELKWFRGEVPTWVLATALDVKRELDARKIEHGLLVNYLGRRQELADPFLVLSVSGLHLYLEAWDEPGFFKERQA